MFSLLKSVLKLVTKAAVLTIVVSPAFSQAIFEGRVEDRETREPIAFASIGIVGSSKGTVTNIEGRFSLVATGESSIKISCVGYESMVLDKLGNGLIILLTPSVKQLKEVVVFGKDMNASRIVARAMRRVSKNYGTKSFVQKFFYRHYCKDDTTYGRLIEGAAEVWKKKGYRLQQPKAGYKESIRITQIRRSFDKSLVAKGHVSISLPEMLEADVAGYQLKSTSQNQPRLLFLQTVSGLKTFRKDFDFKVSGLSTYDGEEVYEISYKKKPIREAGIHLLAAESGTLYITTKELAIVKYERRNSVTVNDTTDTKVFYKKFEGKYYPYHVVRDGRTHHRNPDSSTFRHWFHIELMSTEIQQDGYEKFKTGGFDKGSLLQIPFDSTFWKTYNIVKTTPLEDTIVSHLGGSRSLNKQFSEYHAIESFNYFSGKEGEEKFNRFREESRGGRILYIDFWASWCGPCIKEMSFEKKLAKEYNGKITFVMLSVDGDDKAWKAAIERYKLARPGIIHYRIGAQSDAAIFYDVAAIPKYVLIRKNGEHFDLDAKRPSNPELKNDLDLLIREQ